jgi:hypothetical protein
MTEIDRERLKLLVIGDIAEDLVDNYDIELVVENAVIEDGMILVDLGTSGIYYDPITYEQLGGGGGS